MPVQEYRSDKGTFGGTKPTHDQVLVMGGHPAKRFVQFDYTHGDVEVFDGRGQHLGSADPETGAMTKPAVPGRTLAL